MTEMLTESGADVSEEEEGEEGRQRGGRRRKTFTLEHRPGQTMLILSELLGNRQGT